MRELLRTNDLVLVSFVTSLLNDEGIDMLLADAHLSAMEGSIGAFPRRVLVDGADLARARRILGEAGLQAVLSDA